MHERLHKKYHYWLAEVGTSARVTPRGMANLYKSVQKTVSMKFDTQKSTQGIVWVNKSDIVTVFQSVSPPQFRRE